MSFSINKELKESKQIVVKNRTGRRTSFNGLDAVVWCDVAIQRVFISFCSILKVHLVQTGSFKPTPRTDFCILQPTRHTSYFISLFILLQRDICSSIGLIAKPYHVILPSPMSTSTRLAFIYNCRYVTLHLARTTKCNSLLISLLMALEYISSKRQGVVVIYRLVVTLSVTK